MVQKKLKNMIARESNPKDDLLNYLNKFFVSLLHVCDAYGKN